MSHLSKSQALRDAKDRMRAAVQAHPVIPPGFDKDNAFLIFATCHGDIEKTARSLNMDPVKLLLVAQHEHWAERIQSMVDLQKSSTPQDIERGINRAINLVQAHRLRMCCEAMIERLSAMSSDEIFDMCITKEAKTLKSGEEIVTTRFNTRPLADLASAMEKAHQLTYQALNDTSPERAKRVNTAEPDAPAYQEIHAAIASQMAEVARIKTPQSEVFKIHLAEAEDKTFKQTVQEEAKDEQVR